MSDVGLIGALAQGNALKIGYAKKKAPTMAPKEKPRGDNKGR